MDALTGLLDGPRARGAFLLRALLEPPWSVRIQDKAPLSLVAVLRGSAVVLDRGDPVRLARGDVVVVTGAEPYTFADSAATPVQVVIQPGDVCTTPDGAPMSAEMDLGVRTWGNSPTGSDMLLIGTYHLQSELSRQLLRALPPLLVLRGDAWDTPLLGLLADEIGKDDPGQEAVLDRLLDLLLIAVLRSWFARPGAAPAWYRAHADAVVGRALRLMQHNPAHPWTVAELAQQAGVSRAALARRFTDLVGEPPMSYLTGWRLTMAADLLREPDATIGAVARQVGYGSSFALSTAFKRVRGITPRDHRLTATG
jgi:AraC-like DNA-binding protein